MTTNNPTRRREIITAAICGAIVFQLVLHWWDEIVAVIETIKKAGSL